LDDNFFTFKDRIYEQVSHLFMGASLPPILASIFMYEIDERISSHNDVDMDDSIAYVKASSINQIAQFEGQLDRNIDFTHECPVDDSLLYSDILIISKRNRLKKKNCSLP
jgi:hypothetical protein